MDFLKKFDSSGRTPRDVQVQRFDGSGRSPKRKAIPKIGDVIGKRTIIEWVRAVPVRGNLWRVLCSCGSVGEAFTGDLRKTERCRSCAMSEVNTKKSKALSTAPGYAGARSRFSNYKTKAKSRGYTWELSFDFFYFLTKQNCFYCNDTPRNIAKTHGNPERAEHDTFVSNGIDRRDNTQGYTENNSVACCAICNTTKMDHREEDFLNWIARAHQYQQTKKAPK